MCQLVEVLKSVLKSVHAVKTFEIFQVEIRAASVLFRNNNWTSTSCTILQVFKVISCYFWSNGVGRLGGPGGNNVLVAHFRKVLEC